MGCGGVGLDKLRLCSHSSHSQLLLRRTSFTLITPPNQAPSDPTPCPLSEPHAPCRLLFSAVVDHGSVCISAGNGGE